MTTWTTTTLRSSPPGKKDRRQVETKYRACRRIVHSNFPRLIVILLPHYTLVRPPTARDPESHATLRSHRMARSVAWCSRHAADRPSEASLLPANASTRRHSRQHGLSTRRRQICAWLAPSAIVDWFASIARASRHHKGTPEDGQPEETRPP